MRSSRLQHPQQDSYWASNIVYGVGIGTQSLVKGITYGIGGVVYQPIIGGNKNGFSGFSYGVVKGIGGLVAYPVKGTFDFIA